MKQLSDEKILDSWHKNASPWTVAIAEQQIESRNLVTNQAIVDAVVATGGRSVVDIGCGEGWLVRELTGRGLDVLGIDAVAALIDTARQLGGGRYCTLSYEQMAQRPPDERFDTAVCNFSLLGRESVAGLFATLAGLLNARGCLIVQTIHPLVACGDQPYRDGWREGSWQGFSDEFSDPAPWYFRTLESWTQLFVENDFALTRVSEPLNPQTGKPASVLFVGLKADS